MVEIYQLNQKGMSTFRNEENGGLGGIFGQVFGLSNPRQSGVSNEIGIKSPTLCLAKLRARS